MSHAPASALAKPSKPRSFLAATMGILLSLMLCPVAGLATLAHAGESASGMDAIDQAVQHPGDFQALVNGTTPSTTSIGIGDEVSLLATKALPRTFDLRHVDKNGDGAPENYVSSVKRQNPWGTCWAFGAIGAMEASIAYDSGLPSTELDLDLSERHLSYFTFNPLSEANGGNQSGEGFHLLADGPNAAFQGGSAAYAASMVSSGVGPVPEALVPYRGNNGIYVNKYNHPVIDGKAVDNEGNVLEDEPTDPVEYWSGDDWSVPDEDRFASALQIQHSNMLPETLKPVKDETGKVTGIEYDYAAMNAWKTELVNGHAIAIGFCADTSLPGQAITGKYINLDTWAHYTYDGSPMTHEVCIVGYDDNYSKENFNADHQPPASGAWIAKNSWGAATNEFPNTFDWGINGSGYFYISYYDTSLTKPETFEFNVANSSTSDEFLIGQYDYMPSVETPDISSSTPIYMANAFTAPDNIALRALSTQTATANTTVTYDLYRLNPGYASPTDGTLVASVTESYPYAGYHRVDLDRSYPFAAGTPLSIVVTTKRADGTYEICYDRGISELGVDVTLLGGLAYGTDYSKVYNFYAEGVINPGESFVGTTDDGTRWIDWSAYIDGQVQDSLNKLEALGILDAVKTKNLDTFRAVSQPDNMAALRAADNFPIKFYAEHLEDELPFTDLGFGPGETPHWAALDGHIGKVYHDGLMSGYADENGVPTSQFGPNDPVTRAQVASTLFKLGGPTDKATLSALAVSETKFLDVAADAWYASAMKWAEQKGVFSGTATDEGVYARPDDPITREELATVLYRYGITQKADISDNPDTTYRTAPDAASVSEWATTGMEWAFDHGIMTGYGSTGALGPQNHATRGEYAKMLINAIATYPTA